MDQYEIPNYDTIDYDYHGLTRAYLMSNSRVYNGQPHIPNDISQWTGVMSDWNGKSNSEVLKKLELRNKDLMLSQVTFLMDS